MLKKNTFLVVKKGFGKTIRWVAKIFDYESAKEFKRNYFDFEDLEIEVNKLTVGDIIELREQTKKSFKYCYQFSAFIFIVNITSEEIEFESFETIAKAYKAHKTWINSPIDLKALTTIYM